MAHSKPGAQLCPTCGKRRVSHKAGYYECDTPDDVILAMKSVRFKFGNKWKSKLVVLWRSETSGRVFPHFAAELRWASQNIGPTRLYKIKLD